MMNEAVESIMTKKLLTVTPENNLSDVRRLFIENSIHHLPVVERGKLVGILTTYDLWKNEIAPKDYKKTLVADVMTKRVARISPKDKIGTAAELFLDNRFHALPVVDNSDQLLGIVTSFDILLYEFKKEYPKPILFQHLFDQRSQKTTHVSA
jgi:CBS domain-containing protein